MGYMKTLLLEVETAMMDNPDFSKDEIVTLIKKTSSTPQSLVADAHDIITSGAYLDDDICNVGC